MADPSKHITAGSASRSWWQVLTRVVVWGFMLASVLYVTLPWWLPTSLVRGVLERQLSRQAGVGVRIEGVSLSWSRGVEIRGLSIASPEGFGAQPLAQVPLVRADFSPIRLLVNNRIAWMELTNPTLIVRVNAVGDANTAPLSALSNGPQVQRIAIRQAGVTLELQKPSQRLRLNISDLQVIDGQRTHLGSITMSAALVQDGTMAPVTVRASDSGEEDVAAASATFAFSDVDLGQLHLPAACALPLARLEGRCSGFLNLRLNRQAVVDRINLNITIRHLDVQPNGPAVLPVIDEAGLRLSAAYDILAGGGGRFDVESATIRLPGLDLTAQGTVYGDIRLGDWDALRDIRLSGTIQPGPLAALLTGHALLAGMTVDGPVRVELSAQNHKRQLTFHVVGDASAATVSAEGRVLKPADRPLRLAADGDFDFASGRLGVSDSSVAIGDNVLTGKGSIAGLPGMARRLYDRPGIDQLMQELSGVEWHEHLDVRDAGALAQLADPLEKLMSGLQLSGPVSGDLYVRSEQLTQVRASLHVPGATEFSAPGVLSKPAGEDLRLEGVATLAPAEHALTDLDFDVFLGDGRLGLDGGRLEFDDRGNGGLRAQFHATRAESLLACIPRMAPSQVADELVGSVAVSWDDRAQRLDLKADLGDLSVRHGPLLLGAGTEARRLTILATRDLLSGGIAARADLNMSQGVYSAAIDMASLDSPMRQGELSLAVKQADLAALARSLPDIAESLEDLTVRGLASGQVAIRWKDRHASLEADLDVTSAALADQAVWAKPLGMTARAKLSADVDDFSAARPTVRVSACQLTLGSATMKLSGTARLTAATGALTATTLPAIETLELLADGVCPFDEQFARLAPMLAEFKTRHSLDGQAQLHASLTADGQGNRMHLRLDAAKACASARLPLPDKSLAPLDLVKPIDLPADVELDLLTPADLSHVQLIGLKGRLGELEILADALADVRPGAIADLLNALSSKAQGNAPVPASGPGEDIAILTPRTVHVSVSTSRAEELPLLCPAIKGYCPSGGLLIEGEWRGPADGDMAYLNAGFCQLAGVYRDKPIVLDGRLSAGGLSLEQGQLSAKTLRADSLELQAGANHGWIIADLTNLPARPTGTVHVMCESLDDGELTSLLEPAGATSKPAKLTAPDIADLQALADKDLQRLRRLLGGADLTARITIDKMRTLDARTSQVYQPRGVALDASIKDSQVKIAYEMGLNGGTYTRSIAFNLADNAPRAACRLEMKDAVAAPNLRPQLMWEFPGNTVQGMLNRSENLSCAVRDLLAGAIDGRYPVLGVGTATTIAIDGVLRGRAAPKFVTDIFPGLNLTEYAYRKMTGFATFDGTGAAQNEMFFDGQTYDVYIVGTTGSDRVGRYEIGLVLLGKNPEWNRQWQQGRIPILKFKARIEDGKLYDEEVSFPMPTETLFLIFLKRSPVYLAWKNWKG